MAYSDSSYSNAAGAGLTTFATTGNPWLSLLAGGISFFSSESASKAQQEYNAQLAALAATDKNRQKAGAVIQKEMNVLQHQRDVANAESFRKSTVYRESMLQAGIAGLVDKRV